MENSVNIFFSVDYEEHMGTAGLLACVMSPSEDFAEDMTWEASVVVDVLSTALAADGVRAKHLDQFEIVYPNMYGQPLLVERWRFEVPSIDNVLRSVILKDGRALHCVSCVSPDPQIIDRNV